MAHDVVSVLKRISAFKDFTDMELEILASVFRARQFKEGETLCTQGDAYASFFLVINGEIASYRIVGEGTRIDFGTAGAGSILGQKSLIDGKRRSATMETTMQTVVLECNRNDFDRLFKANSKFAYKMLDFIVTDLSKRLRSSDKVLESMLSDPGRTLSSVLDALSEASGLLGGAAAEQDDGPKAWHVDI
jgi:CRP/FNR family transcriptional regulator, cyclic AMP receptor protein